MKTITAKSKKYGDREILVDDEDFPMLSEFTWYPAKRRYTFYAAARIDGTSVHMHRLILKAAKGQQVDHQDRDGLNNQRSNIRIATVQENQLNRRTWGKHSKHRGVDPNNSKANPWRARVSLEGRQPHIIGYYKTEKEAAIAYNNYCDIHNLPNQRNIIDDA